MVDIDEVCEPEWAEWYGLSPQQRWARSQALWRAFLMLGGSHEPETDTQSPSSMTRHQVRCLLMGGQVCVFYGAAEFSRDTDLALLPSDDNFDRFRAALAELLAEPVAVPPFQAEYLQRGHAAHFRCRHPDAAGMRIDVMTVMRGVAPFEDLWERRVSFEPEEGEIVDLMGLEDLVQAKN